MPAAQRTDLFKAGNYGVKQPSASDLPSRPGGPSALQAETQACVIEAVVGTELCNTPAIDETARADVRAFFVLVREAIGLRQVGCCRSVVSFQYVLLRPPRFLVSRFQLGVGYNNPLLQNTQPWARSDPGEEFVRVFKQNATDNSRRTDRAGARSLFRIISSSVGTASASATPQVECAPRAGACSAG